MGTRACSSFIEGDWLYLPKICNTEGPFKTEGEAVGALYRAFERPTNCELKVLPIGSWLSGGPYSIQGCMTLDKYSSLPAINPNTGIETINYRPYEVDYTASRPSCNSRRIEIHHIRKSRDLYCPPGMRSDTYGTTYVNGVAYSTLYCFGNNELKELGGCTGNDVGNPVNTATGNKFQREVDYRAADGQLLKFERFYNSAGLLYSKANSFGSDWFRYMGRYWRHTYDRSIVEVRSATLTTALVYRPDGRVYLFNFYNDQFHTDADIKDRLVRLPAMSGEGAGWKYTNALDDTVESYDENGKLTSIVDRAGRQVHLSYSDAATPSDIAPVPGLLISVADSHGRALKFIYDAQQRIVAMIDPGDHEHQYTYDTRNNLTSVIWPTGERISYSYGEAAYTAGPNFFNLLTGVTDETGARYATYRYDAQGRAISSEHAGGVDGVALGYNANGTTTVTDARGTVRTYSFQTVLGVRKNTTLSQPCVSGCGPSAATTTYDANGNVASRTDFNGVKTTYVYDVTRNLETSRTEASGTPEARTITTQWHPTFRLPVRVTEPIRRTDFSYDGQGNLLSRAETAPDTQATRTWRYTYDASGHALTEDGPRDDVADLTTYAYWPLNAQCPGADEGPGMAQGCRGQLKRTTDPAGHVTEYLKYDAHGRLLHRRDPNGAEGRYTYDARGRLTSRAEAGLTTAYGYDPRGLLARVTLPQGAVLRYEHDAAHRLVGVQDNLGNRVSYTLDAAGNRVKETLTDPAGTLDRQVAREFDALSRLQRETWGAPP